MYNIIYTIICLVSSSVGGEVSQKNMQLMKFMMTGVTTPVGSAYRTRGRSFLKEKLRTFYNMGMTGTGKAHTSLIKKAAAHTGLTEKQVVVNFSNDLSTYIMYLIMLHTLCRYVCVHTCIHNNLCL